MLTRLRALITPEAAADIVRNLGDAPFEDGKRTATGAARAVKNNLQLPVGDPTSQRLANVLLAALSSHQVFRAVALPHTILPLRFCKYLTGMEYGEHLDLPVMGTAGGPFRTDLSLTVWLSPRDSYDGGELVFRGDGGEFTVKGNAGDAVVYASTSLHRVTRVTRGERVVAISWIQSLVRSEEQRAILFALAELTNDGDPRQSGRVRHIQHQLLRMWAQC